MKMCIDCRWKNVDHKEGGFYCGLYGEWIDDIPGAGCKDYQYRGDP